MSGEGADWSVQSYQVPDYTAYDQVLSAFKRLIPIPTILEQEDRYRLDINQMKKDVHRQGLSVMVASNPRNPTGQVIAYVVPSLLSIPLPSQPNFN